MAGGRREGSNDAFSLPISWYQPQNSKKNFLKEKIRPGFFTAYLRGEGWVSEKMPPGALGFAELGHRVAC